MILVTIGNIAFAIQVSFINKLVITFSMCLSKGKLNISESFTVYILVKKGNVTSLSIFIALLIQTIFYD